MTRGVLLTAGLMYLGMMAVLTAADEKPKSIKEVMAAHKKGGVRSEIQADLKSPTPDWASVQKKTKAYADAASVLPSFTPPKGDPESFQKLAKTFSETINELDKGAQSKDAQVALAALKKSQGQCMSCHKAHRGS